MKVMISAGEASGDIHAASVVEALTNGASTSTPIELFGMGGKRLADAGMEILVDVDKHAVMGLLEVLHKYPALRANLATLRKAMTERKPDVLVLVDYPHFNMKLAATAKSQGIPVLFFIAPKVWASRAGRIAELEKLVDHMAVILPFEKNIFDEANIPCTYVGNPLMDNKPLTEAAAKKPINNTDNSSSKKLALLPGSRKSEITMLLPPMLETCESLTELHNGIEFVLPVADTIDLELIESITQESNVKIDFIKSTDYETLRSCDAALVASGTATLELAVLGIPMVVIYKLKPLSYKVLKRWLTIEHISLVNIIADKRVVPEILQDDVTKDNLLKELNPLLLGDNTNMQQRAALSDVYKQLGTDGASERTAEIIVTLATDKITSDELAAGS